MWSRLQDAIGSGIDATKFSEPEVSYKFIVSFATYKFLWHLYFDTDESGERAGVVAALKSTAWDLTGVALEKHLEPFIKAKFERDGLSVIEGFDNKVKEIVSKLTATLSRSSG